MPMKMVYICSCGDVWDTSSWTAVESHLDANPTHTVVEGYAHGSGSGRPREWVVESSSGSVYRMSVDDSGAMSSWGDTGIISQVPRVNLTATTDPTTSNDSSENYRVGSRWINTITGDEFVCFDASPGSAVWGSTTSGNATWGSDAVFAESRGLSVTTSTKFNTKVILNATATATGTYRLAWGYGWNSDTTSRDFRAQILDGESIQIMEHRQEAKDSSGTGILEWRKSGTDQRYRSYGVLYLDLNAGAHTFTLQWCTSGNGNEASIWDATLEFWRHS